MNPQEMQRYIRSLQLLVPWYDWLYIAERWRHPMRLVP